METFAPTTTVTPSIAHFEWQESFMPNNTPPPNVCSPPSCALQCAPNTKTHPQWCVFVFGAFPTLRLHSPMHALECMPSMKQHPHWCVFMFCTCSIPSNAMRRVFPSLLLYILILLHLNKPI